MTSDPRPLSPASSDSASSSIHGHDVLALLDSPVRYTRATLLEAIHERFGREARFHTCSAQGMNAAELLDFLDARGKFFERDEGLRRTPNSSCEH